MKSILPTLVLLSCYKQVNCTFYHKSKLHESGSSIAITRGGAGEEKSSFASVDKLKTKLTEFRSKPIDDSTETLTGSLQSFVAGILTVVAVTRIPAIYPLQKSFKDMAASQCANGHSSLFAFPSTISASIMFQDQYNGKVIGGLLMMSSLLLMNSKMGTSTLFPSQTGYFGAIFDTVRWLLPALTLFMIPHVPVTMKGVEGVLSRQDITHSLLAIPTFIFFPILEIINAGDSIVRFLRTDPWGTEFLPCDDEQVARKSWCKEVYKYMWLSLTVLRVVVCLVTLYSFIVMFSPLQLIIKSFPAENDCGVLENLKSFFSEALGIYGIALMIITLNLSQMCESACGQVAPFLYVLPLTLVLCKRLKSYFVPNFLALFNMKENYLKLLGIENSNGEIQEEVLKLFKEKAGEKCEAVFNLRDLDSCDTK